jgi:hypothetical protein
VVRLAGERQGGVFLSGEGVREGRGPFFLLSRLRVRRNKLTPERVATNLREECNSSPRDGERSRPESLTGGGATSTRATSPGQRLPRQRAQQRRANRATLGELLAEDGSYELHLQKAGPQAGDELMEARLKGSRVLPDAAALSGNDIVAAVGELTRLGKRGAAARLRKFSRTSANGRAGAPARPPWPQSWRHSVTMPNCLTLMVSLPRDVLIEGDPRRGT